MVSIKIKFRTDEIRDLSLKTSHSPSLCFVNPTLTFAVPSQLLETRQSPVFRSNLTLDTSFVCAGIVYSMFRFLHATSKLVNIDLSLSFSQMKLFSLELREKNLILIKKITSKKKRKKQATRFAFYFVLSIQLCKYCIGIFFLVDFWIRLDLNEGRCF